jgi:hypothetical protein
MALRRALTRVIIAMLSWSAGMMVEGVNIAFYRINSDDI